MNLDTLTLPTTGAFNLAPGTYVATRPKILTCKLVGDPAHRPIIKFTTGSEGTGALQTVFNNNTAGCENIDFILGPGTVAVAGEGGFLGKNATITGGGGIFHGTGNSHVSRFEKFVVADTVSGYYCVYVGPLASDHGAAGYSERTCAGLDLIDCEVRKGVAGKDHVLRLMGFDFVRILRGRYHHDIPAGQRDAYHAMVRAHHGNEFIAGSPGKPEDAPIFEGLSCTFGPMVNGDGGVNLPPGPKRDFFDKMRLNIVRAYYVTFDTTDFRLLPGIKDFTFDHCKIIDRYGDSIVDTPATYMNRPRSNGRFVECSFEHRGTPPGTSQLFSDVNGARDMKLVNPTFVGKVIR